MKKTLLAVILTASALLTAPRATAQAADGLSVAAAVASATNIVDFISTDPALRASATNWTLVPYVTHARGLKDADGKAAEWGGGLAALYPVAAGGDLRIGPRVQWLAGNFYTMSATVQYSPSYQLFGTPLTVSPVAYTGVMLPFGGASASDRQLSAVVGAGFSVKYRFSEKLEAGVGYGYEDWPSLKVDSVEHFALVLNWRF